MSLSLGQILPILTPYAGPAKFGAVAGAVIATVDHFAQDANTRANYFGRLAKNLVIGALAPAAAKLAKNTFTLLFPEASSTIAATLTNAFNTTQAAYLGLPAAYQIGIPIAIVAFVITGIFAATLLQRRSQST